MNLRFHHWILCVGLAFSFHGALAYALFFEATPDQGAKDLGVGGLEVSISMVAAAASQAPQEEVLEQVEAEPEPEETPIIEAEQAVIEEPTPAEEPVEKAVKEIVQEVAQPRKESITPPQKPAVKPKPVVKPTPVVKKTAKPPQQKQLAKATQGAVINARNANSTDQVTREGGSQYVGPVLPSYETTLRRWLEQHKTYPKKARKRRQEGTVTISFTLTRDGHITQYRIKDGSGHKALDEETIKMLKRAQPLPKFPAELKNDSMTLTLPIRFALRS